MTASQKIHPKIIEASFTEYTERLAPLNDSHPQHQGLLPDEFANALQSTEVVKTPIEVDGEQLFMPQLGPVSSYGWLHEPFYRKTYPTEYSDERLLHFSDLPNVEPGNAVRERLVDLAADNGVLVFDFPSSDPEQPSRIVERLEGLGITTLINKSGEQENVDYLEVPGVDLGSIALLGTQTYHVCKGGLKRPHAARKKPLTYGQAFNELVELGEIDYEQFVNGVSMHQVIEGDEAKLLQRFYDDAYQKISNHPCKQGMDPDEFGKKLLDERTEKAVYRRDGVAEALCLVTENLADLTWVNEAYYRTPEFRQRFGDGPVTWFPALATDPTTDGRNLWKISRMFSRLSEWGDNRTLIVFDTPDMNTGFLDVALDRMINRAPETSAEFTRIGNQKYCAMRLAPKE